LNKKIPLPKKFASKNFYVFSLFKFYFQSKAEQKRQLKFLHTLFCKTQIKCGNSKLTKKIASIDLQIKNLMTQINYLYKQIFTLKKFCLNKNPKGLK